MMRKATGTALTLRDNEAHVWFARTVNCARNDQLDEYRSWLSADERECEKQLMSASLKAEFVTTRALCRAMLSAYDRRVAPSEWRFAERPDGRADIDVDMGMDEAPELRINTANVNGLVACVVTRTVDAGVDVEDVTEHVNVERVAQTQFAPAERLALRVLADPERRERFFQYWTLKEAYAKARGLALSLPFDGYWFEIDETFARVKFGPAIRDDASQWQFTLPAFDPRYRMAVALRCGRTPFIVQVRETIPSASGPL